MSSRSIRRAVERQAFKDARQPEARPGPRTAEGKAKSCLNAVTTALTGRTVLLPSDDVDAYSQHVQDFADEFKPVGPREAEFVQALADHAWRLNRIASLEMAIFASGHEQFAEQFADRGAMQASFTQMHTFLHYEKQLRNLQIQEARIRRNREKDTAELRRMQQERLDRTASVSESVVPETALACAAGFDFSFRDKCAQPAALHPVEPCEQASGLCPQNGLTHQAI